jgi:uncharacterized protein (UPF0254 family)
VGWLMGGRVDVEFGLGIGIGIGRGICCYDTLRLRRVFESGCLDMGNKLSIGVGFV